MAECRDWQIIDALMTLLRTITTVNHYEINVANVFIPKKVLKISSYPAILVYYDETVPESEGFNYDLSNLDVILVYTDGLNDENETNSYIYRYRNVGADIRKAIMTSPSLGGLCEYVKVETSHPALFMDGDEILEAHVTQLKISRVCNQYNPYL